MARRMITRQPSKAGKQEGVKAAAFAKVNVKPAKASLPGAKKPAAQKSAKAAKEYDPVAPARVQAILNGLDDRYGDVTRPTFTLYQVSGNPLAWTAQAAS